MADTTNRNEAMDIKILCSSKDVTEEFRRCCRDYDEAYVAVAWCGKPGDNPGLRPLSKFGENLHITVGVSFCGTAPEAIGLLIQKNADIRVFDHAKGLFHPKVFLFIKGKKYAAIVGSANLTKAAFSSNVEVCSFMRGTLNQAPHIKSLQKKLLRWHADAFSFVPTEKWLKAYRLKADKMAEVKRSRPAPPKRPGRRISRDDLAKRGVTPDEPQRIQFRNTRILFTGGFDFGNQAACRAASQQLGADCPKDCSVSSSTGILVVGSKGSPNWLWKKYGKKIKKAAALRKKQNGRPLIITEDTWEKRIRRRRRMSNQ
jgi:hypothetical protein